jgi:hypothetical protein
MSPAYPATDRLKSLKGCADIPTLRSALHDLCAEFGRVTRLDVMTMAEAEKRRALCFLRLESAAQERELMRAMGMIRSGEDVLVIVDMPSNTERLPS